MAIFEIVLAATLSLRPVSASGTRISPFARAGAISRTILKRFEPSIRRQWVCTGKHLSERAILPPKRLGESIS
jgi:hypothetical protein